MKLEELLNRATPRPWEEGASTAGYQDLRKRFPPFEAISISNNEKGPQIAIIPLDESSRDNLRLLLHAVNKLEGLLTALREIAKGEAPFKLDPLEFANALISKNRRVAEEAIRQVEEVSP